MGYISFCKGYSNHVLSNNFTNYLIHKPGIVCEVDWSGSTMSIVDKNTGEIINAYLFVATLPHSQYSYVEPCLDMKQDHQPTVDFNLLSRFAVDVHSCMTSLLILLNIIAEL